MGLKIRDVDLVIREVRERVKYIRELWGGHESRGLEGALMERYLMKRGWVWVAELFSL